MASKNQVAGFISLAVNGVIQQAKGSFTYNIGKVKREAIVGADRVHGFKAMPQVPFIDGEITDRQDLDVEALMDLDEVTITLSLANGKTILLEDAWYAADGDIATEEANIQFRFEGLSAEEVAA